MGAILYLRKPLAFFWVAGAFSLSIHIAQPVFGFAGERDSNARVAKMLMGCYPYWNSSYKSSSIPFSNLTHVNHAFLSLDTNGNLIVPEGFLEPELLTRAHGQNVKVIAVVGGMNKKNTQAFRLVAANTNSRKKFAKQLNTFLRLNKYDGADIDWEFPSAKEDRENEVLLIREIHEVFQSPLESGATLILGMATPAGDWYGRWTDFEALDKFVDFFNVMTFDYHGSWSDHSGHLAALFSKKDPKDKACLSGSFEYVRQRGVSPAKINLGLAFYGLHFTTAPGLHQSGAGPKCPAVGVNFSKISKLLLPGSGWREEWDEDAQVPYLLPVSGNGFITFDNGLSFQQKVKFVRDVKAKGLFIWELSGDLPGQGISLLPDIWGTLMAP